VVKVCTKWETSPRSRLCPKITSGLLLREEVQKILVSSPHRYYTLKNEYPELEGNFNVIHVTQYLSDLIKQQKVKFGKGLKKRVVYQDPCYLGQYGGMYDEPRQVLKRIPGLAPVKMRESCEESLCSGGGGGEIWMDTEKRERPSELRLGKAIEVGAEVLAVACPYCLLNFEGSRLTSDIGNTIEIKDVSELLRKVL